MTRWRSYEPYFWKSSGVVLLLLFWEFGSRSGILPERYISRPTMVLETGLQMLLHGGLIHDIGVTAMELAVGRERRSPSAFLGLVAGWYKPVRYARPMAGGALRNADPRAPSAPGAVVRHRHPLDDRLVVLSALFPIVINTLVGAQSVDVRLLRMARSFARTSSGSSR